jgi:hypothetical protein
MPPPNWPLFSQLQHLELGQSLCAKNKTIRKMGSSYNLNQNYDEKPVNLGFFEVD